MVEEEVEAVKKVEAEVVEEVEMATADSQVIAGMVLVVEVRSKNYLHKPDPWFCL